MTLTLEIPDALEAQLRADATARRVPVETLAVQAVEVFLQRPATQRPATDEAKSTRRAALSRLAGRYPSTRTVADFMADRSAEEG